MEPSDNKTSEWVEKRLGQYLKEIKSSLKYEYDKPFLENLLNYSKGFWKGLFACYDNPLIPRTNNDLELFFRRTKQKHRRITGSRTWNRYIIRHGENIVFADNTKHESCALEAIQKVPYERYEQESSAWTKRISEHTKQRRFKRDPNVYLLNIEKRWAENN